jgi:hypothetical protein
MRRDCGRERSARRIRRSVSQSKSVAVHAAYRIETECIDRGVAVNITRVQQEGVVLAWPVIACWDQHYCYEENDSGPFDFPRRPRGLRMDSICWSRGESLLCVTLGQGVVAG